MSREHLGLFHSELFQYLQNHGLEEKTQELFDLEDSIPLEKKILEVFPGLLINRGLPRLYHRDSIAKFRVKKEFSYWPALKELIEEKEIVKRYENFVLTESSKVCFFTWVIWDGWGDYIAAAEAISILKEKFPDLQIDWVLLVCSKKKMPDFPSICKMHIVFYEKEGPVSLIPLSILQLLRSSHLVIQIPTYYPATNELQERVKNLDSASSIPRFISIGEYGFLESQWFHPRTSNRSMGLHFLEKGILIRKRQKKGASSFSSLENQELINWIFPSGIEEEKYLSAHHFYVAYLATAIGGAIYLHALLKTHELSEKGIDICSPDIGWLVSYLEFQNKSGRPILESDRYFLEVYTKEKIYTFGLSHLKKVRIFCPGSISSSDFHILMELSGDFIGVRGNQSFSEAISISKPFFYDGREHARYFIKDLVALAENRIRSHRASLTILRKMRESFIYNLEKEEKEWVEETHFLEKRPWQEIAVQLGQALQSPKAALGFRELAEIIRQEYAFNEFFCHLVQKELCHFSDPERALQISQIKQVTQDV